MTLAFPPTGLALTLLARAGAWSFACVGLLPGAVAQMTAGADTLYGDEWIVEDQDYLKLSLVEEGVYRITANDLTEAGWSEVRGAELQVWAYGSQVPIYVASEASWDSDDYLTFFADRDRAEAFDQHIYEVARQRRLSPDVLLAGDTLAYFLTRGSGQGLRLADGDAGATPSETARSARARTVFRSTNTYVKPRTAGGAAFSSYREGEGFSLGFSPRRRVTVALPGVDADAGTAGLAFRTLASSYDGERGLGLTVDGESLGSYETNPNVMYADEVALAPEQIRDGRLQVELAGTGGGGDRYALGLLHVDYPAILSAGDASPGPYWLNGAVPGLTFSDAIDGGAYVVYVPGAQVRGRSVASGTEVTFALPGLGAGQRVIVVEEGAERRPAISIPDFGSPIDPGVQYLVVGSERQAGWSVTAADWAGFRGGPEAGGYRTAAVDVEQLYDRFGYGVTRHPLALRNAFAASSRRGDLAYVLLYGKGRSFDLHRTPAQLADAERLADDYIPTFGQWGADNLLTYLPGEGRMCAAIGRLAVRDEGDGAVALAKTRAAIVARALPQRIGEKLWTKKFVHLGGGSSSSERVQLRNLLNRLGDTAAASDIGAYVRGFYKDSDAPVQDVDYDRVFEEISEGAAVITFMGHASPQGIDYNIDRPEAYRNAGRYPFMLSLGCYSGDMFKDLISVGENFMFYEDKGTVAFAANTGYGYPTTLYRYGQHVYSLLGGDLYGEPIGDALRVAAERMLASGSAIERQMGEQQNLQGDPALKLYPHPGPDLVIDAASLRVRATDGGAVVTSSQDSLRATFDVYNLGRATRSPVRVAVARSVGDEAPAPVDTVVLPQGVGARETVTVTLPTLGPAGGGLNRLYATALTPEPQPAPGAQANDDSGPMPFVIAADAVALVSPHPGAVVTGDSLSVYAYGGSAFAEPRGVEYQVSRSPVFEPGSLVREGSLTAGALVRLDLGTSLAGEGLHHARMRLAGDTVWAQTRFRHAPQARGGYALGDAGEFATGTGEGFLQRADGSWEMDTVPIFYTLLNKEYDPVNPPLFRRDFDGGTAAVKPWTRVPSGVAVLVGDLATGEFQWNRSGEHGSVNLGGFNRAYAYPASDSAARADLIYLLDEVVQPGQVVMLFAFYRPGEVLEPARWALDSAGASRRSLSQVLRENGAEETKTWEALGTVPYTVAYVKGGGQLLAEDIGASRDESIETDVPVPTLSTFARWRSEPIRDAGALGSLSYLLDSVGRDSSATATVRLLAQVPGGGERELATLRGFSGASDLRGVDVTAYPAIALELVQEDAVSRRVQTPRALTLTYAPKPNLVYDPAVARRAPRDTIVEGGSLRFEIGVRNLSPTAVDSPIVASVYPVSGGSLEGLLDTLPALAGGAATTWSGSLAELPQSERLDLAWELNPQARIAETSRAENLAYATATGLRDDVAPTLRVEVDGELLVPGALVTPDVVFVISSTDIRGDRLALAQTADLELALETPDGRILTGAELPGRITVAEADDADRARWEYHAEALPRGTYRLNLEVADGYGNRVDSRGAKLEFEVDDRRAVSNFVPYPNPMVDRTRFAYELSGEAPDDWRIDIVTTSGRHVRSLGPAHLGPLRVGRNLTEGSWNGTDEFGQRLAAGVYLYRVATSDLADGTQAEHRETGMDEYFRKGFGKLVILPR